MKLKPLNEDEIKNILIDAIADRPFKDSNSVTIESLILTWAHAQAEAERLDFRDDHKHCNDDAPPFVCSDLKHNRDETDWLTILLDRIGYVG